MILAFGGCEGKDFPLGLDCWSLAAKAHEFPTCSLGVAREGTDFRKVMPLAAKETRGRAEGKRVQEIVRELTA